MTTPPARRRTRTALAAVAALLGTAALATLPGSAGAAGAPDPAPRAGEVLFDDFAYTSHTDPALGANGWHVRSNAGGPGVPGATWDPSKVTFAQDDGNSVMTLETSTAGTGSSTTHTEILTQDMKFQNGTYASRVRFSDAPTYGPDGDRVVQTFFSINDLTAPMADDYAEYDFEYLPNGGWGETDHTFFTTSWETYNPDPWEADNQHTADRASYEGWRDLVFTIDDQAITYYVDGEHFATHDARFLPERPMSINFNQWLIDLDGLTSSEPRAYDQQVDYVLHVKDQVLTPAEVAARVADYRAAGTTFVDEVPSS